MLIVTTKMENRKMLTCLLHESISKDQTLSAISWNL